MSIKELTLGGIGTMILLRKFMIYFQNFGGELYMNLISLDNYQVLITISSC